MLDRWYREGIKRWHSIASGLVHRRLTIGISTRFRTMLVHDAIPLAVSRKTCCTYELIFDYSFHLHRNLSLFCLSVSMSLRPLLPCLWQCKATLAKQSRALRGASNKTEQRPEILSLGFPSCLIPGLRLILHRKLPASGGWLQVLSR